MRRLTALMLALAVLAALTLACTDPGDEWEQWQGEVMERQRAGLPTDVPTVEVRGE